MITAGRVRAALRDGGKPQELVWDGKVLKPIVPKKPKKRRKKHGRKAGGGSGLMPPHPKRGRVHVVPGSFVWEDLQRALKANSAHGVPRVEHERKIEQVSGLDVRRRIRALGFTVTQFGRRHGVSGATFYDMTHLPAGMVLTRYLRLIEFEEFLAAVVDILEDDPDMSADDMRAKLDALLTRAAERL